MSTLPQVIAPLPPSPAPPAARRVSIADRVARSFPPLACVRGFRYFARSRIHLVSVTDGSIDADVKGKRTQRVRLRVDGGRLASACTCSAKLLGPAACRHVWATLLEIDRRGSLESLRLTGRTLALGMIEADRAKPPARKPARTEETKPPARRRRAAGEST